MRPTLRTCLALVLLLALAGPPATARPAAAGPAGPLTAAAHAPPPADLRWDLAAPPPPGAAPGLAQTLVCAQALADPQVDLAGAQSPWAELRPTIALATDQSRSAPRSIKLVEDADGAPASGGDVDSAGQEIAVPADVGLIYGSLRYRVAGSPAPAEQIQLELYLPGELAPADRVAVFAATTAGPLNSWLTLEWELADERALAALAEAGRAVVAVTLRSAPGAAQTVWVDDISARTCTGAASVAGQVTQRTAQAPDLSDARLLLVREDGAGQRVLAATTPDAAGAYRFDGVPALAAGARYRVWFLNWPLGAQRPAGRIGFWAGPAAASLAAGERRDLPPFDISDVDLLAPGSYAAPGQRLVGQASLSWSTRGDLGERYQVCVYDPARLDGATGRPAQLCGPLRDPARDPMNLSLSAASLAAAAGLGFQYERVYHWYVAALRPGADGRVEQYGYSFYERAISFAQRAAPPPAAPSADVAGLPAAPPGTADWTLVVYGAGDNALGDPRRTPGVSRLDVQLAQLAALAPRYPGLRIVSYADLYGDAGAQICLLRASGGPDCRARAEPNSADPATLRAVVGAALKAYPARRALVLLAGPGHALGGFGSDETSAGAPSLSAAQIGAALAQASADAARPVDLLLLQAPLMGELSAAAALADGADYLVAASDQIWQLGWYDRLLPLLAGASRASPRAVAAALPAAYDAAVAAQGPGRARSMAAYDLGRAVAAQAALDRLGAALGASLASDPASALTLMAELRATAQPYDSSGNGLHNRLATAGAPAPTDEDAFYDAAGVATLVGASPLASSEARAAAQALRDVIEGASPLVLASVQRSGASASGMAIDLAGAEGLALFLPGRGGLGGQATLAELALYGAGAEGGWGALLRAYLAASPAGGPGGVTAGPGGGARFAPPMGGGMGVNLWLPLVGR